MSDANIEIRGAREHNLCNISLKLPRNKLIVITGLSGSGKSTLAFDTIFAEGQRRYVESLSAYARQFLEQMRKPDVDYIEGLSPAISIEQKTTSKNPRSTVGTVTEVYDYMRLLYANIGRPHCYKCGKEIMSRSAQEIVDQILKLKENSRIQVLAPVVRGRKGEYRKLLSDIRKEGFIRLRIDGELYDVNDEISLDKNKTHDIDVVVDRLVIKKGIASRLTDSVETALSLGQGVMKLTYEWKSKAARKKVEELLLSEHYACLDCGLSFAELTPRMFSFNSPHGACPTCTGLGVSMEIDPDLVVPDPERSLGDGAIKPWSTGRKMAGYYYGQLTRVAEAHGFSMHVPFRELPKELRELVLYGSNKGGRRGRRFEGVIPNLERRFRETSSDEIRDLIARHMSARSCHSCNGARLRPESVAVTVGGKSVVEVTAFPINEAIAFVDQLELTPTEAVIARRILKEIRERLSFMANVGLEYLTLDRSSATLSGGESQRIRLATQIGAGLVGVLYILDEPSIGLHQRDNRRLLKTLKRLRDIGNTVIVVEHDEETIRGADHVVDLGPGAGVHGGKIVAQGTPKQIARSAKSLTGRFLRGDLRIEVPEERRRQNGANLTISGATINNLHDISATIPLGLFTCVTGVSGSGKSSLINLTLYPALARILNRAQTKGGHFDRITGIENLDKVIDIDQSPIGRTPRSNPATYTGLFTHIRELFGSTPEARIRGYKPGRFSFNVKGGRCEACGGGGMLKIEMHFLPDVYVPCDVCQGKRYNRETLEVRYKGKNIAEVLDMIVEEALDSFARVPAARSKLQTLSDVGLGYIKLGQSSTTLSGGEAQRVKLATELSKRATGRTLYILDEPTTGLHVADIQKLLDVLHRLTDAGNTVVVIEHNLDVIKTADHILDLGPEGGDAGGEVIAAGTPEEVAAIKTSYTGKFLKKILAK
ncbi:excinuclease ABC subunit UvrA [Candidatus Hydrogenedentota bacterium]